MGAITVTNLGKAYKSYSNKWSRVFEWLSPKFKSRHSLKWILKEVTFAISPGESVGIIGLNGAGKSTLLKLIVGTLTPSEGEIYSSGSIVALLELGMGFHPEFTGRQNVYMGCQLLGMSKNVIDTIFPEVEAFAEIGDYINCPLRTYSTGMQMRLAFAIATCRKPDILVIDEALSVGDSYFQHKCIERIKSFCAQGTTLLFVSHSPDAIKSLCSRALMLSSGSLVFDGSPDEVMDYYNAFIAKRTGEHHIFSERGANGYIRTKSGNGKAQIDSVEMYSNGAITRTPTSGKDLEIHVRVKSAANNLAVSSGILIRTRWGIDVWGTNTFLHGHQVNLETLGDEVEFKYFIPNLYLAAGSYSISVALHDGQNHLSENYAWIDRVITFDVIKGPAPGSAGICNIPVQITSSIIN